MNSSRRGVSLIELLVVLSACTMVLTLSSMLIVRAMRIQMESRAHYDVERNSLRLSDQFRRDVHNARSAAATRAGLESDVILRLQMAGSQQVEYSRAGGNVLRLASENGKSVSREEFAFPAACEISVVQQQSPPQLALTITAGKDYAAPSDGKTPLRTIAIPVSLHVEAALGRDLRHAAPTEAAEGTP